MDSSIFFYELSNRSYLIAPDENWLKLCILKIPIISSAFFIKGNTICKY